MNESQNLGLGLLLLKIALHFSAEWFEGGYRVILLLPAQVYLTADDEATQDQQEQSCDVDAAISLTVLQSLH